VDNPTFIALTGCVDASLYRDARQRMPGAKKSSAESYDKSILEKLGPV